MSLAQKRIKPALKAKKASVIATNTTSSTRSVTAALASIQLSNLQY